MRRAMFALVGTVAVLAVWWFAPWTLLTSSTVDEAAPAAVEPSPGADATETPAAPRELTAGDFVSQEHMTRGRARVLQVDDQRVLRLEGLATSDGPDLEVWLSDRAAGGSWFKYDDGRHVSLGKLKGTHGNQNYAIPDDVDLAGFRSAVIWCVRFDVSFGSAPLAF